jgi:hypothetical protein
MGNIRKAAVRRDEYAPPAAQQSPLFDQQSQTCEFCSSYA